MTDPTIIDYQPHPPAAAGAGVTRPIMHPLHLLPSPPTKDTRRRSYSEAIRMSFGVYEPPWAEEDEWSASEVDEDDTGTGADDEEAKQTEERNSRTYPNFSTPFVPPFRFARVESTRPQPQPSTTFNAATVPILMDLNQTLSNASTSAAPSTNDSLGVTINSATVASSPGGGTRIERRGSNSNPTGAPAGVISVTNKPTTTTTVEPVTTSMPTPPSSTPTSPIRPNQLGCMPPSFAPFSSTEPLPDYSIYRGAYPTLKNFHFLSRLNLKTIISLTPEPPSNDLKEFCRLGRFPQHSPVDLLTALTTDESQPTRIRLYHFYVSKWNSNVCVSMKQAIQCLQILSNAENLPAYIHCIDGCNNTSMVIACLRKLQAWSFMSIFAEVLRFTRESSGILDSERIFIERFNHNGLNLASKETTSSPASSKKQPVTSLNHFLIRIPASLPNWLWNGMHLCNHPLGLKLYDPHIPSFQLQHNKLLSSTNEPAPGQQQVWKLIDEDENLWNGLDEPVDPELEEVMSDGKKKKKEKKKNKKEKELKELNQTAAAEPEVVVEKSDLKTDTPGLEPVESEPPQRHCGPKLDSESKATLPIPITIPPNPAHSRSPSTNAGTAALSASSTPSASTDTIVPTTRLLPKLTAVVVSRSPAATPVHHPDEEKKSSGGSLNTPLMVGPRQLSGSAPSTPSLGPMGSSSNSATTTTTATTEKPLPATTPPSTSSQSSVPKPGAAKSSTPLSHLGEFHSLLDLEKSGWNRPISFIKCDMLFVAGSYDEIRSLCDPSMTPTNQRRTLEPDEEQFVEMADDYDDKFTRDEFDTDVTPLVASLALEGFTMNHKLTRPMQLFHTGQA